MMQASALIVTIHGDVCHGVGELDEHVNIDHVVLAILVDVVGMLSDNSFSKLLYFYMS